MELSYEAKCSETVRQLHEHVGLVEDFKKQILNRQTQMELSLDERFGDGFSKMQQRLMTELRAETSIMLKNEASAVAVLDEQLWLTDQRLGQRIDELAQTHLKERLLTVEKERRV